MAATVYRVYSRNASDFVVAVSSTGKVSTFFNLSEFEVANVMRMYEEMVLTMSISKTLFKKTPYAKMVDQ